MKKLFKFEELPQEIQDKIVNNFYQGMVADHPDYTLDLAKDFLQCQSDDVQGLYTKSGEFIPRG